MKYQALLSMFLAGTTCAGFAAQVATQNLSSVATELNEQAVEKKLELQAKGKIKQFSGELKTALVSAIQKDGLASAVAVCQDQAPEIAAKLSTDGWTVARTSLKTRNAANVPDEWETLVLASFEEQAKAGEPISKLSATHTSDGDFRYMKAIPTGQLCLACHGSSVDPDLQKTINARYPHDTATGFALNDIRGAFTISKDIAHE